jgi:hypothetical protein
MPALLGLPDLLRVLCGILACLGPALDGVLEVALRGCYAITLAEARAVPLPVDSIVEELPVRVRLFPSQRSGPMLFGVFGPVLRGVCD